MSSASLIDAFDKRVQRRLNEMCSAAATKFGQIDADCSARGIFHSSMRLQRQAATMEAELKAAIDWALAETEALAKLHGFERSSFSHLLISNLRRHFYHLNDSVRWGDGISMMVAPLQQARERMLATIDGDLSEFEVGIWKPRNSEVVAVSSTTNHLTINGPNSGSIQQAGSGSSQAITISQVEIAAESLVRAISAAPVSEQLKTEMMAEIETIRLQSRRSSPNEAVMRAAAEGLKALSYGVAGNLLTPPVTALLAAIGMG